MILVKNDWCFREHFSESANHLIKHHVTSVAFTSIDAQSALEMPKVDVKPVKEQLEYAYSLICNAKACVLTIHAEFGVRPESSDKKPTIHYHSTCFRNKLGSRAVFALL